MHAASDRRQKFDLGAMERDVDTFFDARGQPGFSYGVLAGGRLLHSGGRGVTGPGGSCPDQDTVFRIASMTKSFTAAAVLVLRDRGALRLDDEVATYVPEAAALRPPTDDAPPVTVRSLLTMTAGLPTDDPWGDHQQDLPDDDFAALLRTGLTFAWTPGTTYEYSNLGYALLGRVITAAAGEPYRQVIRERLLEPLRMTATTFSAEQVPPDRLALGHRPRDGRWLEVPFADDGAFAPMGGLFSSVRDLARWVAGFTDAYPPRDGEPAGRHPLRRSTRREQQLPHFGLPAALTWSGLATRPVLRSYGYGFGLLIEQAPEGTVISHSGGYPGFGSHMRWHPDSGLGVIVLANSTYAAASRLATRLLAQALTDPPCPGATGTCGIPVASGAPAPSDASESMAAATAAARDGVNQLIDAWDDELAARLLADNVDADEPLTQRRAAIERYRDVLGPLVPDEDATVTSTSPAHCSWWLRGPRGRIRVEIRLTPQRPPLVQSLTVVPVPDPPARLRRLADLIGASLADPRGPWPLATNPAPSLDKLDALYQLKVAASWAGRSRVAEVLTCDGVREATFRLVGERTELLLRLAQDPDTHTVTAMSLIPYVGGS